MNALSHARTQYSSSAAPTRTYRSLEYDAVAQVTRRMQCAARKGQAGFSELVSALHDNRRLWSIFAADVADAGNSLPPDLRAKLFYLAEFTNHHTRKVLSRQANVVPLMEVNMSVMRGLKTGGN